MHRSFQLKLVWYFRAVKITEFTIEIRERVDKIECIRAIVRAGVKTLRAQVLPNFGEARRVDICCMENKRGGENTKTKVQEITQSKSRNTSPTTQQQSYCNKEFTSMRQYPALPWQAVRRLALVWESPHALVVKK